MQFLETFAADKNAIAIFSDPGNFPLPAKEDRYTLRSRKDVFWTCKQVLAVVLNYWILVTARATTSIEWDHCLTRSTIHFFLWLTASCRRWSSQPFPDRPFHSFQTTSSSSIDGFWVSKIVKRLVRSWILLMLDRDKLILLHNIVLLTRSWKW